MTTPINEEDLWVSIYTNGTGIVAVRIVHMPTGVVVSGVNKREAMGKLRHALSQISDVVFREENGEWEVFVDTDGCRSIRRATGTEAVGVRNG